MVHWSEIKLAKFSQKVLTEFFIENNCKNFDMSKKLLYMLRKTIWGKIVFLETSERSDFFDQRESVSYHIDFFGPNHTTTALRIGNW